VHRTLRFGEFLQKNMSALPAQTWFDRQDDLKADISEILTLDTEQYIARRP
jgi:hypothetical protein